MFIESNCKLSLKFCLYNEFNECNKFIQSKYKTSLDRIRRNEIR